MSLIWGFPASDEFDKWLGEAADAGYDGVTCFVDGIAPLMERGQLAGLLDKHGLRLAALDWPLSDNLADCLQYFSWMQELGCSRLVCIDPATGSKDYGGLATRINEVGRMAKDAGIECFYHNHTAAIGETYSDMEQVNQRLDPGCVSLMLDVGHATKDFREFPASERALRYLKRYGERVTYLELKDWCEATDLNTPLGEGEADWAGIFSHIKSHCYSGWLTVEHNGNDGLSRGRIPSECARISREFLRSHLGV
jgi:sugar phosphate isomerase/epimerase